MTGAGQAVLALTTVVGVVPRVPTAAVREVPPQPPGFKVRVQQTTAVSGLLLRIPTAGVPLPAARVPIGEIRQLVIPVLSIVAVALAMRTLIPVVPAGLLRIPTRGEVAPAPMIAIRVQAAPIRSCAAITGARVPVQHTAVVQGRLR